MPSRPKRRPKSSGADRDEDIANDLPLPTVEPYTVLGVEKSATDDQIRSAYRKAALRHHPDKAPEDRKQEAHIKFQEIAFAYAVLSDPKRKKRFDLTGSTAESLSVDEEDLFCWVDFFREQFKEVVSSDAIEKFALAYKGSEEEKEDLLAAYQDAKGKWAHIYEVVILSDPLEDEERFREIIDQAIEDGNIKAYKSYTNETARAKKRRLDARLKEKKEVAELAQEVGAEDLLKTTSAEESNSILKALIKKKNSARSTFLDDLEAKYAPAEKKKKVSKGKNSKKRGSDDNQVEFDNDEPSEEVFLALRKKIDQKKNGDRKSKRAKN
ncbi:putative J domain-containing protein [Golovinomyces cichoracearum]|uniref:Putative J domain-containing protein n=1 Tax=Golovinomyces cichoracearum TaxID=62708 RepID=A0A420HGM9_9PEZI|nr:putative J domain-containing protein [Golovinomyces cichoracearum]